MDISKIIFQSPLYSKWKDEFQAEDEDGELETFTISHQIEVFNERIDLYCTKCQTYRVFATDRGIYRDTRFVQTPHYEEIVENKPIFYKTFRCSANKEHRRLYGFLIDDESIVKISEFPSKYDSIQNDLNKYEKVLPKDKVSELAKAAQLESFGYSIASFLHYRRIFETIIFETFKNSKIIDKIEEPEYRKYRMEDKIGYIKDFLPEYFTANSFVYGVLSKGIHELSEQECSDYLPVVKEVIIFSLEEALEKRTHQIRKEQFSKKLADIKTKLE